MRRVKADAYRHAHGQPLKPLTTANDQLCFEDFGLTYRERLMAVEREILWQRTAPPMAALVATGDYDGW